MIARRLTALVPGAILLAAAVSACGGDGVAEPGAEATGHGPGQSAGAGIFVAGMDPPTDIDVCSLLTPVEASELAGEELRTPVADVYPNGQSVCTFGADRFMSYTFVQVSLFVETPDMNSGKFTARQVFEDQRKANAPATEVDGIGEDAYRHANTLEVLAGPVTLGVRIAKADPGGIVPVPGEDLEAMARIVLGRLSSNQG